MKTILLTAAFLGLCLLPTDAWALGTEAFGNTPLHEANYTTWPGVMSVINDPARVYQQWVNGNESFLYSGDTAQLNKALESFSKLSATGKRVVLRPGPGIGHTFDQKEIPCHWQLHIQAGIAAHIVTLDQGDQVWNKDPELIIYIGDTIKLDELKIPTGLDVVNTETLGERIVAALEKSTDQTVRGWGCGQLASLDKFNTTHLKAIAGRLDDKVSWVQLNAAGSVGFFGAKATEYLPKLRELAKSEDENLRQRATDMIAKIEADTADADAEAAHAEVQSSIAEYIANYQKPASGGR